jgi:hypothetical protein
MDLKQIVLQEAGYNEYAEWKIKWDKVKPELDCLWYAKIKTPLIYSCHEEAIYDFLQHKDAHGISVFDKAMPEGMKWRRLFKKDVNESNIGELVRTYADAARAQVKKRVFEMKFGDGYFPFDLLIISFSAFDNGRIVSTCIEAPSHWQDVLQISGNKPSSYHDRMMAVWMPETG